MNQSYVGLLVWSSVFLFVSFLIIIPFIILLIKYNKMKKQYFELRLHMERMPYEMCLNCDKSK